MPRKATVARMHARIERLGQAQREWWLSATPEQRDEAKLKSWQGFKRKNPERAELIEKTWNAIHSGELQREPCDTCGEAAKPLYDWVLVTVVGWRCVPCRRAAR